MKIYILNHYMGGTPMDSHTMGIYKTLKEAKEEFNKSYELFGYEKNDERIDIQKGYKNGEVNIITEWFIDDDSCDFWGGCSIQEMEVK
mgnify:CR=1 FL=1